jgi:amidophosphoribosyltransferase
MCGICGVYILNDSDLPDIARALESVNLNGNKIVQDGSGAAGVLFFLLKHLNNRGHDSAGIVTFDGERYHSHNGMGFAEDVIDQSAFEKLSGHMGIGHDRYATTGLPRQENIQPFVLDLDGLVGALSHNGNLTNEKELRDIVIEEENRLWDRSMLTSTTDSELILHKLCLNFYENPELQIEKLFSQALNGIRGAYSLTAIINDNLLGLRDPYGFWPLFMARLGNIVMFSSEETPIRKFIESAGYKLQSSDFLREVKRGDIEAVKPNRLTTHTNLLPHKPERECSFDFSYLRWHEEVKTLRKTCGSLLWELYPVEADFVVPVPRSGIYYAHGLSEKSGIPYKQLIGINPDYREKQHRGFLEPNKKRRLETAKEKYTFPDSYEGLRIILPEDSIVRGTTLGYLIKTIRLRNIDEIHVRAGTPAFVIPCYLGVHTPTKNELIANSLSESKVEKYFESIFYGVDYSEDRVISFIKRGSSVEEIVAESIKDKKNYLKDPEMRKVVPGKFSLKYIPLKYFNRAFDLAGLNSKTKCYACQIPDGNGYPMELKKDLQTLGVI